MSSQYETFEHTADIGLRASADSLEELFAALGQALANYICPVSQVRRSQSRPLNVKADDLESLAVDFLGEVLGVVQFDHFMVAEARVSKMTSTEIWVDLLGEGYDPTRHEIAAEVKGVTYHQLKVEQQAGRWVASVLLDI